MSAADSGWPLRVADTSALLSRVKRAARKQVRAANFCNINSGCSGCDAISRAEFTVGELFLVHRPTKWEFCPQTDFYLGRRIQRVDATDSLNISAGVWKPSVLRGLSFNCLAIALS